MANNYTQFCVGVPVPTGNEQQVRELLTRLKEEDNEKDEPEFFGIDYELGDGVVYLYSEGACSIGGAADLVQAVLEALKINMPFAIEWAETCSKSRPGEFGGGAVIVQRGHEPLWMSTGIWVCQQIELRNQKKKKES